jgi:MFS family permease
LMHLPPVLVTLVFGVYAVALLGALLIFGGLSDFVGRRPVILAALILNAIAMLLFVSANDFMGLIASRVVQGICVGMATTTLGAAIFDTSRTYGAILNSTSTFIGLAIGSLGSSVLTAFAPNPHQLVYEILFALTCIMIFVLWFMPETTSGKAGAMRSLKPNIYIPKQSRAVLIRATPANIAAWAFGSFYLALMPTLIAATMHNSSPLVSGVVISSLMASGAVSVATFRNWPARRLIISGTSALALGVAVSLYGIANVQVGSLLLGTVVAGAGFGANFSGTLRALMPTAHPDQRAGLLSSFYVQSYLAFSIPAVAAGLAVPQIGMIATAMTYGAVIIALALSSLAAELLFNR